MFFVYLLTPQAAINFLSKPIDSAFLCSEDVPTVFLRVNTVFQAGQL